MAPGTKCDSNTNREGEMNGDGRSTAGKGGRVLGGRGNLSLVMQPLALGGERRGNSGPPGGQGILQPLVWEGIEAKKELRNHLTGACI